MFCTVTKSDEMIICKKVSFIDGFFNLPNTDTFLIELMILATTKVNLRGIDFIRQPDTIFDLLIELILMLLQLITTGKGLVKHFIERI